jgi:hypothetical protein
MAFAPAASIVTPTQAATPDFQGIWARVSFPGFGRPITGAGPVIRRKPGIGFCRRLHQSNLEAAGGRNREKAWGP